MRVVILTEYHSHGAPVVGNVVQTQVASVYLVEDIDPEEVFGVSNFSAAHHVKIIERGPIEEVETLVQRLETSLSDFGTAVAVGTFYDE
ncbi:MAG: hypothetical protein AAGK09_09325 [Planctomycetota bacterium]